MVSGLNWIEVTEELFANLYERKIGPGLAQIEDSVLCSQVGILKFQRPDLFWVDHYDHKVRSLICY